MLEDSSELKLLVSFDNQSARNRSPSAYSVECSWTEDEDRTSSLTVISLEEDSWSPTSEVFPRIFPVRSRTLPDATLSEKGEEIESSYEAKKHKRIYSFSKSSSSPEKVYLRPRNGRTISGTPVIRSVACLNKVLPDCYIQDESNSESRCLSLQLDSSSEELRLDYTSIMTKHLRLMSPGKTSGRRSSLRSWEMNQSSQIVVTGGPMPGFYDMKDRIHGRPSWSSGKAILQWSIESKAWLLSSAESRRGMCLAMLREDTINPCYSHATWRVSSNGSVHCTHEAYSLKPDKGLVCTPSSGSGMFDESQHPDIEENEIVRVRRGLGISRFIGKLEDQVGTFVGVELFTATGLNNGTRKGYFYFEAKQDHGIFVRCPAGIIEKFGQVTDKVATIIDNLLAAGKKIMRLNQNLENRVIKTLLATTHDRAIFCASRIEILEIILFYELIMVC